MKIKTFIVDAFTDEAFKGNPAGVCLPEEALPVNVMQNIAMELNLSETAFVSGSHSENRFSIRYFTPTVEIDFCGHATFASARVLMHLYGLSSVHLITQRQLRLSAEAGEEKVTMQFPLYESHEYPPNKALLAAAGIDDYLAITYSKELSMLLIRLKDKQALLDLSPDFAGMLKAESVIKELVVTAHSDEENYDFFSRCFCPWIGINEDPVTGAVHCALAPFWQKELGLNRMRAFQCSKRGGYLELNIVDGKRLDVTSNAKIILTGVIEL